MSEITTSEFGKGLTYCLGLFLCHSERDYGRHGEPVFGSEQRDVEMWFYGAADHLFDLEIPETLPELLHDRLSAFKNLCLTWRLPMDSTPPTAKDKDWAINEAKELLRLVDETLGVATAEAQWK